jgi:hypothetical protein
MLGRKSEAVFVDNGRAARQDLPPKGLKNRNKHESRAWASWSATALRPY